MSSNIVFSNGLYSVLRLSISLVSGFLIYVFVFDGPWKEIYGMWALILSTFLMGKVFDITGGQIGAKFIAEATNNIDRKITICTILIFTLITSALMVTIAYNLNWYIHQNLTDFEFFRIFVVFCAVLTVFNNLNSAMISLFDGLFLSKINTIAGFLGLISFISILIVGVTTESVELFFFSYVAQALTTFAVLLTVMSKKYKFFLAVNKLSYQYFIKITSYGVTFQFQSLVGLSYDTLPKILIGKMQGLSELVEYELLFKIASTTNLLVQTLFTSMFPLFSAQNSYSVATDVFYKYKLNYIIVSALVFSTIFLTTSLVSSYLDYDFNGMLPILFGAWFLMSISNYKLTFYMSQTYWKPVYEFNLLLVTLILIGSVVTIYSDVRPDYVASFALIFSSIFYILSKRYDV